MGRPCISVQLLLGRLTEPRWLLTAREAGGQAFSFILVYQDCVWGDIHWLCQGKFQLLPAAPPYYPIPRGKIHTMG